MNWREQMGRKQSQKGTRTRTRQLRDLKIIEMRELGFANPDIAKALGMKTANVSMYVSRLIREGRILPRDTTGKPLPRVA